MEIGLLLYQPVCNYFKGQPTSDGIPYQIDLQRERVGLGKQSKGGFTHIFKYIRRKTITGILRSINIFPQP